MTAPICSQLPIQELENTFFYPGPQSVSQKPGKAAEAAWEKAKEICIECPLFLSCREERKGEEYGVWGGTDQYERHQERYRMSRRRQKGAEERVAAEAARIHAMCVGRRGLSVQAAAYRTGYSPPAIRMLIQQHKKTLEQPEAPVGEVHDLAEWVDIPEFPEASPTEGDAWVWYFGQAHYAYYMAETSDGAYLRMKIKPVRAQTTKWLPKSHVDLRTTVTPVVRNWAGRPDADQAETAAA